MDDQHMTTIGEPPRPRGKGIFHDKLRDNRELQGELSGPSNQDGSRATPGGFVRLRTGYPLCNHSKMAHERLKNGGKTADNG